MDNSTLDAQPVKPPIEAEEAEVVAHPEPEPDKEADAIKQLRQEVGRLTKQLQKLGKDDSFFEHIKAEALITTDEGSHQYYLKVIDLLTEALPEDMREAS